MRGQLVDMRRKAVEIFQAGLQAVAPGPAIRSFGAAVCPN